MCSDLEVIQLVQALYSCWVTDSHTMFMLMNDANLMWTLIPKTDLVVCDTDLYDVMQDMFHSTQTGFKTLENTHKPLVCKELRRIWENDDPNLPWKKGDYNESNTLLLDDSPYKALLNPVRITPAYILSVSSLPSLAYWPVFLLLLPCSCIQQYFQIHTIMMIRMTTR